MYNTFCECLCTKHSMLNFQRLRLRAVMIYFGISCSAHFKLLFSHSFCRSLSFVPQSAVFSCTLIFFPLLSFVVTLLSPYKMNFLQFFHPRYSFSCHSIIIFQLLKYNDIHSHSILSNVSIKKQIHTHKQAAEYIIMRQIK